MVHGWAYQIRIRLAVEVHSRTLFKKKILPQLFLIHPFTTVTMQPSFRNNYDVARSTVAVTAQHVTLAATSPAELETSPTKLAESLLQMLMPVFRTIFLSHPIPSLLYFAKWFATTTMTFTLPDWSASSRGAVVEHDLPALLLRPTLARRAQPAFSSKPPKTQDKDYGLWKV